MKLNDLKFRSSEEKGEAEIVTLLVVIQSWNHGIIME